MKFTIDTNAKTIVVLENTKIKDLYTCLTNIFGDKLEEYTLITTPTTNVVEIKEVHFPVPSQPFQPYVKPWDVNDMFRVTSEGKPYDWFNTAPTMMYFTT